MTAESIELDLDLTAATDHEVAAAVSDIIATHLSGNGIEARAMTMNNAVLPVIAGLLYQQFGTEVAVALIDNMRDMVRQRDALEHAPAAPGVH